MPNSHPQLSSNLQEIIRIVKEAGIIRDFAESDHVYQHVLNVYFKNLEAK